MAEEIIRKGSMDLGSLKTTAIIVKHRQKKKCLFSKYITLSKSSLLK